MVGWAAALAIAPALHLTKAVFSQQGRQNEEIIEHMRIDCAEDLGRTASSQRIVE